MQALSLTYYWGWGLGLPTKYASVTYYFGLKLLMKHPGFPGSSDGKEPACNAGDPGLIPSTLLYPRKQEITLMWMGACSPSVGRGHSIARDMESGAKKPVLNIHTHFVISLIYYYSPNCLDSLLMGHSKPKFLCPVNSSQILLLLCVKKYKRCLLWPLLRSHLLWELCVHELKVVSFITVSLSCQFYY